MDMTFKMTAAVQYLEERFDKWCKHKLYLGVPYVRPMYQLMREQDSPNWANREDAYVCRFGTYNVEEIAELPQLEELEEVA